jgi:AraC-like DNA-binding protein
MDIEIKEPGFDKPFVYTDESGFGLSSHSGFGKFTCIKGNGFSVWNNNYHFAADTLLQARADIPVLELHITRTGIWSGHWDGVAEPDYHPRQFNLTYTPHVLTTAVFRKQRSYRSCDIHFDFHYLESLSKESPELNEFLNSVIKANPRNLSNRNHSCTHEMIDITELIFNNPYNPKMREAFLAVKVRELLIAALEKVALDLIKPNFIIRNGEKESLLHVRRLIENAGMFPPTYEELSRRSGLNEYILKRGFRSLFGVSPYQYYLELKIKKAKMLLLETKNDIASIAYELGYTQPSSFGHEFRKATGLTPLQFRKGD